MYMYLHVCMHKGVASGAKRPCGDRGSCPSPNVASGSHIPLLESEQESLSPDVLPLNLLLALLCAQISSLVVVGTELGLATCQVSPLTPMLQLQPAYVDFEVPQDSSGEGSSQEDPVVSQDDLSL